jgi:hypothetical protein
MIFLFTENPSAIEVTTEKIVFSVAELEPGPSTKISLSSFSSSTSSLMDSTDSSLVAVPKTSTISTVSGTSTQVSTISASKTAVTEVFTFYPGLFTTVSPVQLSTQPTDLTTDLIVFTFDPEDGTSDSFAEEMDEDSENQSTTVSVNSDEIDLTIFDIPSNYQDY